MIVNKLLVLDKINWINIIVYKLFVLDSNTWYFIQQIKITTLLSRVLHISRHWILLVSTHFSLFSTSQLWAVWCKVSAQEGVTSSTPFASHLHCLLVSTGVEIFPGLYNFPDTPRKSSWLHIPLTLCTWTRLLSSMPPT